MKNFWFALGAVLLISSCSDKKEEQTQVSELSTEQALEAGEQIVAKPQFDIKFEEITYHYDATNLPVKCDKGSEVVCAIDLQLKCTINHKLPECDPKKLPKFTFMEDESLQRPSQASFQIVKLKPIDAHTVEVYTKSDCNGVWFGLCKGNIIYVLNNRSGNWTVKDIYALQSI